MSAWRWTPDGWRHAPWWKRVVNSVLRAVQWTERPWLVVTRTSERGAGPTVEPTVRGYAVRRVLVRR